jgi:hypothetical protein
MADRDRVSRPEDRKKDDLERMAIAVAMLFDIFEGPERTRGTSASDQSETGSGDSGAE